MTTSSTYSFSPSVSDLTLLAFGRCLIRRTEITQQHLADAATESNLLQVSWASRQPNLWTAETYPVTLVAGQASYDLPARMISPMAVYMTTTPVGSTQSFDRILNPISTFEYSSLPDKTTQAPPTTYWWDREVSPKLVLWQVPDNSASYVVNLRILSQIQDAKLPSGVTPQIPYRWFDAFASALTARLGRIYPDQLVKTFGPTAIKDLDMIAERDWQIAAKEDIEYVPQFIYPGLSTYYGF